MFATSVNNYGKNNYEFYFIKPFYVITICGIYINNSRKLPL